MSEKQRPQVLLAPLQPFELGNQNQDEIRQEVTFISYDDANQLVLIIIGKPGRLFAFDISSFPDESSDHSQPVWSLLMNEGAEPKLIRCSMGGADVVGIQRGANLIEFIRRDSGNMFVSGARTKNAQIIGFFWVFAPSCDLVLVTNSGLEQYKMGQDQGLKYIVTRAALGGSVQWYKYTHETRLALVGVNVESRCRLSAYQFVSSEVVRIPPFELSTDIEGRGYEIDPKNVHLLRMYGRVYCGLVKGNSTQLCLELYRFFTDKVTLQSTLPLLSHQVKLSVSDSVLVVHYTALSKAQLFDVNQFQEPLGPLTPLGEIVKRTEGEIETIGIDVVPRYEVDWAFLKSNLVIKHRQLSAFRVCLDLNQVVKDFSGNSNAQLVGFLLRRNGGKHPGQDPKGLAIQLIRQALQSKKPPSEARQIFDAVNLQVETFARSQTAQLAPRISKSFVLTPQEMGVEVFRWLYKEAGVDAPYIECMLFEYIRSALKFTVYVPPEVFKLLIDVLASQDKYYQILLLVQLYPEMDSEPLVTHLESLENSWGKTAAAMMVKRLGKASRSPLQVQKFFSKYTDMLASEGRTIEALKVVQQLKLRDADLEGYMAAIQDIQVPLIKHAVERFATQVQTDLLAADQGQGLPVSQIPPVPDILSDNNSE
eukprot:TRINITY_DN5640_c0_g1_i2.p1 TRINITY_DN5640_c0_g1~~TRINITY_DN5640_c0_g1_i2.p1  ORF type:complete len:650 (-),score=88.74 TRINITY_DN5640_c0_g1_i2:252-2201(-)